MNWTEVGTEKPASGTELTNAALSEALKTEHKFTKDRWESFGVKGLTVSHFVLVGEKYFQPDAGANLNFPNKDGNTPLIHCCSKAELAAAKQEDSSMSQEMAMLKTELRAELDVARTQLAAAQEEDSLVLQKMETMKAELAGVRKQAQEQQMVLDKELAEMKIELSACQVREQLKMTTETMCNGGCSDIMLGR